MKPFLFLGTRPERGLADAEYDAVRRYAGLDRRQLWRWRLDAAPLPEIDLEEWSGVILGGGPFNSSDSVKSPLQRRVEQDVNALLDAVTASDHPFLGICYGVGTLARHQRGVVDRTFGEAPGPATITLTPEGSADPLLEGMPRRFTAYVGHKEAVRHLPEAATSLATSETCPVQMFRVTPKVYAVQFHPELDLAGFESRIDVYKHDGYFRPDEASHIVERARARRATAPAQILRNFAQQFATDDAGCERLAAGEVQAPSPGRHGVHDEREG